MFRKFLEYLIILLGVSFLSDKQPYWCISAIIFVFFDAWDWVIGYIEFKKRIKNLVISVPKTASSEELKKILSEEIAKMLQDK